MTLPLLLPTIFVCSTKINNFFKLVFQRSLTSLLCLSAFHPPPIFLRIPFIALLCCFAIFIGLGFLGLRSQLSAFGFLLLGSCYYASDFRSWPSSPYLEKESYVFCIYLYHLGFKEAEPTLDKYPSEMSYTSFICSITNRGF